MFAGRAGTTSPGARNAGGDKLRSYLPPSLQGGQRLFNVRIRLDHLLAKIILPFFFSTCSLNVMRRGLERHLGILLRGVEAV